MKQDSDYRDLNCEISEELRGSLVDIMDNGSFKE